MRIKIPRRKNITITNPEDPLIFYYKFGVRNFYLKRLKMVLKLLDKNGADLRTNSLTVKQGTIARFRTEFRL